DLQGLEQNATGTRFSVLAVAPADRAAEPMELVVDEVEHPVFLYAVPCIEPCFSIEVVAKSRLADLDDQQHIRRCRMTVLVRIRTAFEHSDVGLRLRRGTQADRPLNSNLS